MPVDKIHPIVLSDTQHAHEHYGEPLCDHVEVQYIYQSCLRRYHTEHITSHPITQDELCSKICRLVRLVLGCLPNK